MQSKKPEEAKQPREAKAKPKVVKQPCSPTGLDWRTTKRCARQVYTLGLTKRQKKDCLSLCVYVLLLPTVLD